MTTPLLQALHTQEPEAQIDYLTGESNAVLLQGNPCVHECITMPDDMYFRYKILSFFQLIFKIRKKKYDTIYVLDKHWIFSVTAFLFGISERRGFYRDRLSRYFLTWGVPYGYKVQHEVEYNLSLLETVSPDADMHLFFHVSAKDEAFVQEYLKTQGIEEYVVVINDGGNNGFEVGGSRMLPNDIFQTLLQKLASKYPKILLLAGPNMKSYYDRYTQEENIINVAGLFKIPQSIVLLKYAKKVYTTDC
ncbi:MAG: glycosyltransferase family 9 protein [Candidatus Peribacteria bacterium]|nr:MAG: glycosyltransferase family 9 protein [Candidatus Peribacteria bacterium]